MKQTQQRASIRAGGRDRQTETDRDRQQDQAGRPGGRHTHLQIVSTQTFLLSASLHKE